MSVIPIQKIIHDNGVDILRTEGMWGTKYSCPICGYTPSSMECHIKGWGKAQHLKKIVREHIKREHPKGT